MSALRMARAPRSVVGWSTIVVSFEYSGPKNGRPMMWSQWPWVTNRWIGAR